MDKLIKSNHWLAWDVRDRLKDKAVKDDQERRILEEKLTQTVEA